MKSPKDPLTSEEFKEIYSKVPRIAMDVIIRSKDGIVLSLRDIEPCKGMWHIPGGSIFLKETIDEAVKRIAFEETGVKVNVIKFLGYIDYIKTESKLNRRTINLVFEAKYLSGEFKSDYQSSEIKFFKEVPEKIVFEQGEFLKNNKII